MKKICSLLVFVFLFHPAFSQSARKKALDDFFSTIAKNGDDSGSILVAENGKVLYRRSFGYADAQHKIPNTANTLFQIASISKLFTAIAVLQLYEHKKLDLTDKFIHYFPDFPYPEVTIYHLLANTSGIPDGGNVYLPLWRLNRDTVFYLKDVIPALRSQKLPLGFEPGQDWDYSNINYTLLALLVEKVSGRQFADHLAKTLFKPAGMKKTFQKPSGTDPYKHPNVAYNYAWPFISSLTPARVDSFATNDFKVHYRTWPSEGEANVYTSVADLVNFNKALFKGRLLKPETRDLLFGPSTFKNGKKLILHGLASEMGVLGNFYWGFGNRISLDTTMGKLVWESGGMPGCRANMIQNLTKHQLLIWIDNNESHSAMDNIFGALNIINGKPAVAKMAKQPAAAVYARALIAYGESPASVKLKAMEADTAHYTFDEDDFNSLGYEFLNDKKNDLAFQTFRAATGIFPNSDNLFNSYGEVLARSGKKEEAILMYKRSLQLNPKNEDSKKAVADLEKR